MKLSCIYKNPRKGGRLLHRQNSCNSRNIILGKISGWIWSCVGWWVIWFSISLLYPRIRYRAGRQPARRAVRQKYANVQIQPILRSSSYLRWWNYYNSYSYLAWFGQLSRSGRVKWYLFMIQFLYDRVHHNFTKVTRLYYVFWKIVNRTETESSKKYIDRLVSWLQNRRSIQVLSFFITVYDEICSPLTLDISQYFILQYYVKNT